MSQGDVTWCFRAWTLAQSLRKESCFATLPSLDWSALYLGVLWKVEMVTAPVPASLDCRARGELLRQRV